MTKNKELFFYFSGTRDYGHYDVIINSKNQNFSENLRKSQKLHYYNIHKEEIKKRNINNMKSNISDKNVENEKRLIFTVSSSFVITKYVAGDGNCLFRCFSFFLYNDDSKHLQVRKKFVDVIINDWSNFKDYVKGEYNSYS